VSEPLLHVRLSVDYPRKPKVLNELELTIGEGEILGLVGQSGSGKSTLGLAIPRLLPGTARVTGEIRYRGEDLLRYPAGEMRRIRGKEIGVVFQGASSALNPALRLGVQLREVWRAHRSAGEWKTEGCTRCAVLLGSMQLPGGDAFLERYPSQISIGQAQRILIAMALMHRPALVIADEPTSALDMVTQAEVLHLMRGLRERFGSSLLFISHDLAAVSAACDRLAILRDGEIVESGAAAEMFATPCHPYTQTLLGAMNNLYPGGPSAGGVCPTEVARIARSGGSDNRGIGNLISEACT
jgi:ABC-type dipeptide/oligopeptide/nickel transport system ATPase component